MKGRSQSALFSFPLPMHVPYKIPQSVLVVIYTAEQDVLLIRRTEPDPDAPAFWQSVTGSKDAV